MLASVDSLKADILGLSPTTNKVQGLTDLVGVIANYMNQVQGGPLGSPGIFTLNNAAMIALLTSLAPVNDSSWVAPFAAAFQAGSAAAIITPATVTNPVWIGSGTKDTVTLPVGAATIPTIAAAAALLQSALMSAQPDSEAPKPMAQGIHDATLAFIFTCVGLGPPPALPPIPIPTPAE